LFSAEILSVRRIVLGGRPGRQSGENKPGGELSLVFILLSPGFRGEKDERAGYG
jgi:hypothetical protein